MNPLNLFYRLLGIPEVTIYYEQNKSPIDTFLGNNFKQVPNIAYKNKRDSNGVYYSVYLNQMITPFSYEVLKFKKYYGRNNDMYMRVTQLGDKLAKMTSWVDEQKLYSFKDRYLYPEETLTGMKGKCDCEDVSTAMVSFEPEHMCYALGIKRSGEQSFGHAWPILLYNGKLYGFETTGNKVKTFNFDDSNYDAYLLITQHYTYEIKRGLKFGEKDEAL